MTSQEYSATRLLLPLTGSNNGTTWYDYSKYYQTFTATRSGNTITSTTKSQYYGSSTYFDGSGDYLTIAADQLTGLNFGTGDFTLAFWANPDSGTVGAFAAAFASNQTSYVTASQGCILGPSLVPRIVGSGKTQRSAVTALVQNVWSHVAITRSGTSLKFFINGVVDSTLTDSQSWDFGGSGLVFARARWDTGNTYYKGYMQDFIAVKGAALWTGDFTPASLMGTISNNGSGVRALLDSNGQYAVRTVRVLPRSITDGVAFTTTSDTSGRYSIFVPKVESSVIFEDSELDQVITRIIPN